MLEPLSKLVEESAQQAIVQNKAIPDQFNNAAIKEVTNQIFSSLKGQVSQGNMQQVIAMFQAGASAKMSTNPVISTIISSVTASLQSKFGIAPDVAQSVANGLVPQVISQVIKKSNDPQNIEFDLQHMMRGMTGDSSLDISGMLGQPKGTLGTIGNVFGKLFGK